MMKKILALSISAACIATSAQAATVYQNGDSKVTIGGRLAVKAQYTESTKDTSSTTELENASSRINFGFEHRMTQNWLAGAKAEWGYDALSSGKQEFSNRLGNLYFANQDAGLITVGKQWSTYYDITGWTDVFWIYGGEASGTYDGRDGHGGSGTGRADDAISYRNSFNGLNVAAQYQFEDGSSEGERRYGLQGALSYDLGLGLSFGGAYNLTKYHQQSDDKTWTLGAKYDSDMFYLAGQYGQYRNHTNINGNLTDVAKKAYGYELVAAYLAEGGLYQVYGGYNHLADDNSSARYSYGLVGAAWTPGNMVFSAEYKLGVTNKDQNGANNGADQVALLARYNF
ncbi:porin [Photobacterium damselae subsp. damselae]|uniref:porin n=1 Tax=Photobacterium damselae TaxID=38293 RepID=UPI00083B6A69|nr:porin [Photobacterium damselae]QSH55914.1 porin [Photobacterium damselae subsp. damselae]